MVHLRIVVPGSESARVVDLLEATPSVSSLALFEGAARKPRGDVVLCDVAREDASVVIGDLRELGVARDGSISLEEIDSQVSAAADRAEQATRGLAGDSVVWEEVESRTSETIELNANFLAFMVLACLIASVGVMLGQPVLIVGAMVVGPEFGPLAGLCVAVVQRRADVGLPTSACGRCGRWRSASRSASPPPSCSASSPSGRAWSTRASSSASTR
jgi:hypothetical protein